MPPPDHPYAGERYVPRVPQCALAARSVTPQVEPFLLRYSGGAFGELILTWAVSLSSRVCAPHLVRREVRTWTAWSGNTDQGVQPIPNGSYWIQPDELWSCWMPTTTCNAGGWGDFRLTIHPYPTTNTGDRGGFFIHGGDHGTTNGCITLQARIGSFVNTLRQVLGSEMRCFIPFEVGPLPG